MAWSEEEITRRLPLWWALSDLLLDTDMPHIWGPNIARASQAARFSVAEAHGIFLCEVGPAFAFNLTVVAGEWAGWEQDFVRQRITARVSRPQFLRRLSERVLKNQLEALWQHTLPYLLAASSSESVHPESPQA